MADTKANGEKIPITAQLGDKTIDGAVVKPMSFALFAEIVSEAQSMKEPKTFEARLRRLRMHRQVTYYTNGAAAQVSMADVLKLPIPAARTLVARLDDGEGAAGKIVRSGDGIDTAITYELGKPIPTGTGKPPITELEFLAKTYGDIEDVMAAPDSISQTAQLLTTVAKPLGTSLSQLPSWALNQISVADGVTIARDVLPHFLESPVEIIAKVAEWQYYSASAGDPRPLPIELLTLRIFEFTKVHRQEIRNRILLAGGKPK